MPITRRNLIAAAAVGATAVQAVPRLGRAQAANTSSASNSDSGRRRPPRPPVVTFRPVQCPRMSRFGSAIAVIIRGVISADGMRSLLCTEPTTTSSRSSSSGSWSKEPSRLMSTSMPVRIRNGASCSLSSATTSS